MSKPGFNWMTPVLCVSDLTRSLEHYATVLGFDISWQWSEEQAFETPDKPTFACITRGDACIFLCENGQGNPGSWICLNLEDRDALESVYREYQASAADIVEPPTDCPWGMREMLVRDPDGNTFRIGCQLDQ